MSRRARKVDCNQPAFVGDLERAGAQVRDTSHIGEGFPDKLVLWRRHLFLVEIKNPTGRRSSKANLADPDHLGMLTPSQLKMRKAWPIIVALTAEEALRKMDEAVVAMASEGVK
jgi:hypothetical protein